MLDVLDYIQIADPQLGRSFKLDGPAHYAWPRWSRRGEKIAFTSRSDSQKSEVLIKTVDSVETPQTIGESLENPWAMTWGPKDEGILVFDLPSNQRLYLPDSANSSPPVGFMEDVGEWETFVDLDATGQWMVYASGQDIQVRSIDGNQQYKVSTGFGIEPRWCKRCDELFYRDGNRFYAIKVQFEPEFQWGEAELVWEIDDFVDTGGQSFEVTPDGQRLLVVRRTRELPRDKVHIIQNWAGPAAGIEE